MESTQTIEGFYQAHPGLLPPGLQREVGHFNVFRWQDLGEGKTKCSSYGRKQYYKISLLSGGNTYHYADKSVRIEKNALVFSNPLVPYYWALPDEQQRGMFCLFTEAFLPRLGSLALPEYPVFQPGGQSVFQLSDAHYQAMEAVFARMVADLASDYVFKYDALRHATLELIHMALRLQPAAALPQHRGSNCCPIWGAAGAAVSHRVAGAAGAPALPGRVRRPVGRPRQPPQQSPQGDNGPHDVGAAGGPPNPGSQGAAQAYAVERFGNRLVPGL